MLELPRKRAARGKIAEQESREVETDTELIKLEVIYQVRRVFYELLLAQAKLTYAKQDLELYQTEILPQAQEGRYGGDRHRARLSGPADDGSRQRPGRAGRRRGLVPISPDSDGTWQDFQRAGCAVSAGMM
jgi:hypothetical protein